MDFLKLVKEARTCRIFKEKEPLSEQDIKWLVECASMAPSARNEQKLRFILIHDYKTRHEILKNVRWAKRYGQTWRPEQNQEPPAFIAIITSNERNELVSMDIGIAAQTIQLAAASRGWGCCMIWSFNRENVPVILNLPAEQKPGLLLALGHPNQTRQIVELTESAPGLYWYENDIHYVAKRPLTELIIANIKEQG